MGVHKCRDSLGDRVLGSDNEVARIFGFMEFREEVEIGGGGIGEMA